MEEEEEAPAEEEEFIHETMFTFEAFEMVRTSRSMTSSADTLTRFVEIRES